MAVCLDAMAVSNRGTSSEVNTYSQCLHYLVVSGLMETAEQHWSLESRSVLAVLSLPLPCWPALVQCLSEASGASLLLPGALE